MNRLPSRIRRFWAGAAVLVALALTTPSHAAVPPPPVTPAPAPPPITIAGAPTVAPAPSSDLPPTLPTITNSIGGSGPTAVASATPSPAALPGVSTSTSVSSQHTDLTLGFPELGLSPSYQFAGSGSAVYLQIPAPRTLTPRELSGTLVIPPNFGTGTISVHSGDVFVWSFELPPNSEHQQLAPFDIQLDAAQVVNGVQSVNLELEQGTAGGALHSLTCTKTLPVELINPSVGYVGGDSTPTTIADFFPTLLRKLTIFTPPAPTLAEQTATATIAAAVASAYNPIPVDVSVSPIAASEAVQSAGTELFSRAVVVREGGKPQLSIETAPDGHSADLSVSGAAADLPVQATLLASKILAIVQAPQATVVLPMTTPEAGRPSKSFSELGINGSVTFSGQQQIDLPINSTKLDGVAKSLTVDVLAKYTPIDKRDRGSVSAAVGGVVLATKSLNSSGSLDMTVQIPQQLVRRITDVTLTLNYFPVNFACSGPMRTITFTVDPRSTVRSSVLHGGVGGFEALPQALLPNFQIALDEGAAGRLNHAIEILCGLQRMSGVLLHGTAVGLKEALASKQPVLIVSATDKLGNLDPPLGYRADGTFLVDDGAQGAFTMQSGLAALEAFKDVPRHRTVLLAATTKPSDGLDRILAWLGTDSGKWTSLTGDVLAIGDKGDPQNLAIRAGGPRQFVVTSRGRGRLFLLIGAVFALCFLSLGAIGLLRLRRNRNSEDEADGSEPAADAGEDPSTSRPADDS